MTPSPIVAPRLRAILLARAYLKFCFQRTIRPIRYVIGYGLEHSFHIVYDYLAFCLDLCCMFLFLKLFFLY